MQTVYVDRSRVETYQRCKRLRYLSYHQNSIGLQSAKTPLPLVVGSAVHKGLEVLLREGQIAMHDNASPHAFDVEKQERWRLIEELAVESALAHFREAGAVELDTTELATMQPLSTPDLAQQLAGSLGMTPQEAGLGDLTERLTAQRSEFDKYLAAEQSALVEALVRAYARRRLRPLLEQFVVLEVEREGQWQLSQWKHDNFPSDSWEPWELWFMSRPDALLLERESQQLYLLSFKTAASWDVRKARDAEHDMQGLSEGVEVEKRLGEWWQSYKVEGDIHEPVSRAMHDYLVSCAAPPRILAIRYEYILKGERWKDSDLASRFSLECRSQRSHLIRAYLNQGMASGDEQWNWSWDYIKDTGDTSKLYYKSWRSTPVWEHITIKQWIDMLDGATMAVSGEDAAEGLAPRELGFKCDAQATGYTATHPLDEVFINPIVIYRNEDELRDWIEQVESQERDVAEHVAAVDAATDEGERRHLLNVHFPFTRHACEYPTTCAMSRICWGGAEIKVDPLASGLYKPRSINHPIEIQERANAQHS